MKNMYSLPKIKNRLGLLLLFIADIASICAMLGISMLIRENVLPHFAPSMPRHQSGIVFFLWTLGIWIFVLIYQAAYSRRLALWDEIKFLSKCTVLATAFLLAVIFISKKGPEFSRALLLTMGTVSLLVFPFFRTNLKKTIYGLGLMKRKMLIVGSGEAAIAAFTAVTNEPNLGYDIAGFIDDTETPKEICGFQVHPNLDRIERYIKNAGIHDVIVAKPELEKETLIKFLNKIQHKAENTLYIPDFSGIAVSGTELRHFFRERAMIIEIRNNLAHPFNYTVKRSIDYISGLVIFALALPLIAIISYLIRRDSAGPAILKQRRIGKGGKYFYCYKFRTMYQDAEERLKTILDAQPAAREEWKKYWKLKDDPRVTKAGQWLRATSLDELPQVVNILKGEMSLIGPRPYLPREKEYLIDEGETILKLPPGITGLWQISGRSNTSSDFRIAMDSWYVKNWDLWLDLMILFKTIHVVLNKEGAR